MIRSQLSCRVASLFCLSILWMASGCGGSNDGAQSLSTEKPGPVHNPSANNPLAGITLDNESANMPKIKKVLNGDSSKSK
ncbi:MAG: hypothetical protein WCJ40_15655 [Planctomycetota bacterium]|nr:hypothetical protein [Planctomycetota bacterium]